MHIALFCQFKCKMPENEIKDMFNYENLFFYSLTYFALELGSCYRLRCSKLEIILVLCKCVLKIKRRRRFSNFFKENRFYDYPERSSFWKLLISYKMKISNNATSFQKIYRRALKIVLQ